MSRVGLIVPTLNAGRQWEAWLNAFEQQTRKPDFLLVIDSSSDDETAALAQAQAGWRTHLVSPAMAAAAAIAGHFVDIRQWEYR